MYKISMTITIQVIVHLIEKCMFAYSTISQSVREINIFYTIVYPIKNTDDPMSSFNEI